MSVAESLSHLRVLYVEDEPLIREALSRFLRRRVGTLYEAENGERGLEVFMAERPDLVITDIRMPKIDGLEMSERIRKIDPDVPIVITTAFNDESYFLRAIDAGIDKFLKKPIENPLLLDALSKVGRLTLQQRQLEDKNRLINLILDNISELVMIVRGGDVLFLNNAFLNFSGVPDVEAFKAHQGLKPLLVPKEDSFYKDRPFEAWIKDVIDTKKEEFIVHMRASHERRSEAQAFIVRAAHISESEGVLVTFIDVTSLEHEKERINKLAITDSLTDIFNRKKFNDELERELERSLRYRQHLSLIIFDIDHFKRVNDENGHPVGDVVLQEITRLVRHGIRKSDVFARYGGEEFVILLPENDLEGAQALAEKMRERIEQHTFDGVGRITCSFGVAQLEEDEEADSFIKRADDALYEAKGAGRNCVKTSAGRKSSGH